MSFDVQLYFERGKKTVDQGMARWLPPQNTDPARLLEAMRYSLLAPGKRIRPILVFASADALQLGWDDVLPIAVALEMIHVFSLIHDDLPAMDDDDLRRGQSTNHKIFGEAMAILAGDSLLAQAFVPLVDLDVGRFGSRPVLKVIREIALATGTAGMIGGQVIDMESEGKAISFERLKTLHRLKTGALIRAAVLAPAILSAQDEKICNALNEFADSIGLAFQIADDILDIEGGQEIGKDVGSDQKRGKSTYPSILGMEEAKRERSRQHERALAALKDFDDKAQALREIARFIVERRS